MNTSQTDPLLAIIARTDPSEQEASWSSPIPARTDRALYSLETDYSWQSCHQASEAHVGGDDRQAMAADRPGGRRQEYAEATRQAIVSAARRLFADRGYFSTRVEDIATEARVAPATVYAVSGGKYGLLKRLVDEWQNSPIIAAAIDELARLDDPVRLIQVLSARTRQIREEYSDTIKIVLATAPNDAAVLATLHEVIAYYRGSIGSVAQRLASQNALRAGADAEFATDVLWFYFGFPGLSAMHDDSGWPYDKAEKWLADEAIRSLLSDAG